MNTLSKIADKFFRKQWNIGFARASVAELVTDNQRVLEYTWLPTITADRFFADPFVFKSPDGDINVIYEDFSIDDQYGKISVTTVDKQFRPTSTKEVLDTGSHLSYPNVFLNKGKTYIIPEASKSGKVVCYEYDFADRKLINPKDIVANLPLVDSTILFYNNKYWLFATQRGESSNSKLYIYYANKMDGPYLPHANNPVKNSADGSRPAGNFFTINGEIYRPAQNCAEYYGKSITINKVVVLTENEFAEKAVREILPPKNGSFTYGIHTINVVDDVIVIDALKRIFMPMDQVKTFLKNIFK